MKNLFKQKPKTPTELVRLTRELLLFFDRNTETRESKREEKMGELTKLISEMRTVLYGNGESEPRPEACAQLTQEFFNDDSLRLLILCIPRLSLGARQDATHVVANLQRQRVQYRIIACEYLEKNLHIVDILIPGYEDDSIALTYGTIAMECIRHQSVAGYVLESDHMKKFFEYIQIPNFDIASDAAATFRGLLTRHKSTVAEFLSKNYEWFFSQYNSQLLESSNYIKRRHAIKLLGDVLLHPSNIAVMIKYVSSLEYMRILMNLLRDSNKSIQLEAFHVFKLFVANQNKPPEVARILITNRSKLIRFFNEFNIDKDNEQFEADKAQVVKEIAELQHRDGSSVELEAEKAKIISEAAVEQVNDSPSSDRETEKKTRNQQTKTDCLWATDIILKSPNLCILQHENAFLYLSVNIASRPHFTCTFYLLIYSQVRINGNCEMKG